MQKVPLSQVTIDQIFVDNATNVDRVLAFYAHAYPGIWDDVDTVQGYPAVSQKTSTYIFQQFIDKHPAGDNSMKGGIWMNNGFSSLDRDIADWVVVPCDVTLKGKNHEN